MNGITIPTPSILTLALALEWLKAAPLEDKEKRELRSATRTACRWFNKKPQDVPANPVALRRLFKSVPPRSAPPRGVTKKRHANVKWGVGRLLDLMGIGSRAAHRCPISTRWRQWIDTVSDRYAGALLTRFGRFCSALKVEPEGVSDAVASQYLSVLEFELRVAHPHRVHRETVRLWNRNSASNGSWPKQMLKVPSYTRRYVLPWSAFHEDLVMDVEAYLTRSTTPDPFDLTRPLEALKPSTIATYRDRLRRFATCLVLAGRDASQLRSLHDLVQLDAVTTGLRYLAHQRGAKGLAAAIATLLATIANEHVKRCPKKQVAAIKQIAAALRGKRKGLAPKVRERLAPLKHEANLARLFLLPTALLRPLLRKLQPLIRDAQLFQLALALALLTVCPLRIGSLCAIRIDRHLNWSAGAMRGDLIIEFVEGELKGDEPSSFPIPRDIANLIRVYCNRFRHLLNPRSSPFLFCGRDPGRPRDKGAFSMLLAQLTFNQLGMRVNPHLYRHVVHLVVLRRFPGAYAMVARVLTHRSIATTIQNYSHYDGELAMRAYQRLVEDFKGLRSSQHDPQLAAAAYADPEGESHGHR